MPIPSVGLLGDTSVIVLNQLLHLVLDNWSWRERGQEVFRPVELRLPWLLAIGEVREKEVRVFRASGQRVKRGRLVFWGRESRRGGSRTVAFILKKKFPLLLTFPPRHFTSVFTSKGRISSQTLFGLLNIRCIRTIRAILLDLSKCQQFILHTCASNNIIFDNIF